jgi:ubiquitin-conjugating enzyme E2 variant
MPAPSGTRSRWAEALDLAALLAFAALLAALGRRALAAVDAAGAVLVPLGLAAGYALADLVTGVSHWLCDRVLNVEAPLIGRHLVRAFHEHHDDPIGISRHSFLEVNGLTALAALPLLAGVLCLPAPGAGSALGAAALAAVFGLAFGAVATNQLHAWAHAPRAPRAVVWLQRRRVVLSPRAHALHHRGEFDRAYCVTTGWWNPLLDRWRIFPRLESALRAGRRPAGGAEAS